MHSSTKEVGASSVALVVPTRCVSNVLLDFCSTILTHVQSDAEDESQSESEFEAESDDFESSENSNVESDYSDGSNASEDEGSGSDFSEDDDGEDWDELERKAAKCACSFFLVTGFAYALVLTSFVFNVADKKRAELGKGHGSDDDDDDDRPKKSAKAKPKGKR